ncbi:MAG: histidine phosphatase family protein [Anaerolineales bacterium]
MRIYFARHGESQANRLHEISNRGLRHGLTRKGRQQAEALAGRLQGIPITHIYSSPVLRAIETSVLLANRLNVDYEITEALREYDCGILEGRSDEVAWQGWKELFDAWVARREWDRRIEGGESFQDIRARFEPFIAGLVKRYGDSDAAIACVAHGGVYGMMLPVVLKNVDVELVSRFGFEYTACVVAELRPAGLFCVDWNGHSVEASPGLA